MSDRGSEFDAPVEAERPPVHARGRFGISSGNIARAIFQLGLLLTLSIVCIALIGDLIAGGNPWKQGDWLINNQYVLVRRGVLGDVLIGLSDTLSLPLVGFLVACQIALAAALWFTIYRLGKQIDWSILAIAVLSPSFFTIFWAADPQGSLRKEVLAFLALAIAATGVAERHRLLVIGGGGIFVFAVLGHEALTVFIPAFFLMGLLELRQPKPDHVVIGALLTTACAAIAACVWALMHITVDDTSLICQPLLDRGLDDRMCTGAITWLDRDTAYGIADVQAKAGWLQIASLAISAAVSLGPLIYLAFRTTRPVLVLAALMFLALPVLPLYVIAIDWGRWLSWQVTAFVIVFLLALRTGFIGQKSQVPLPLTLGLVGLGLVLPSQHVMGLNPFGIFESAYQQARLVWNVLI